MWHATPASILNPNLQMWMSWCNNRSKLTELLLVMRLQDRLLATALLLFMLFVIFGSIWAMYPLVFSLSYGWIVFHLLTTVSFSISTIVSFVLVASQSAPSPSKCYGAA
ncbi:hypothetical protein AMTRI_Chr08g159350 [Amborella trichopoda]